MSTPTRKATLPDTPVGRQVSWLLDSAGAGNSDTTAVEEHFAPAFLSQVPAGAVVGILESSDWLRTAELVITQETPYGLKASVLVDGNVRVELQASVEPDEPHRFVGVMMSPPGPNVGEVIDAASPITVSLAEAVAQRYGPVLDGLEAGGIIVGVSRDGSRETFPLNADPTLRYEIGSITKTFTGLLLAEMAGRGEVAFDDPIRKYLPDGVQVPREDDREVTLEDLATHSSGLPRLPPDMSEGSDPTDPYAHIDAERLYADLAKTTLDFPIGSRSVYSNYGFGLLGHLLSLAAGGPFADLVRERISLPLGMTRTEFAPKSDDLAQGHLGTEPARRWTGEMVYGAGCAFESTTDDMLTYGEANVDPDATTIAGALNEAHRERLQMDDRTAMGLGWVRIRLKDSSIALFHNGGTAGFSSSLVCHAPTKAVVVALCSAGGTSLDAATVGLVAGLVTEG